MLLLSVPPMPRSHGLVFFPCCLYPLASIPLACFLIPSFSQTKLETIVRSTRITARDAVCLLSGRSLSGIYIWCDGADIVS